MKRTWVTRRWRRRPEVTVAAMVATMAFGAGLRLAELSLQRHAARAHAAAQTAVVQLGHAIDRELQGLADRALAGARRARAGTDAGMPLASRRPRPGEFWLSAQGRVFPASAAEPQIVASLANDLTWLASRDAAGGGAVFGPVRLSSQWIIAARAPVAGPVSAGAARTVDWSIAYRDLDRLLADAGVGELNASGYDLEISQLQSAHERPQIFFSSRSAPLPEPATAAIHFPAAFPHRPPGAKWAVAIRPRAGWYPLSELATDGAILLAGVWLLTLVAYDVAGDSRRWHAALEVSKRRLEKSNAQLRGEIELREDLQKSLEHSRYHDAFTGLPNRRYFMEQLDRGLRNARSAKRGYRLAVILIGIDRFKLVNDTLGHTTGDELMLQVSRRFQKIASPAERVISRWSADQFAVLLDNLYSIDTAMTVAKMLHDAFANPFELRRQRVTVGASFGVACVESGLHRAEEVVREAAIALSAAQPEKGRNIVPYDAKMRDQVVSLVHLEADLHVALERDELRLLYQPIVHLHTGQVAGTEALLRWNHPVEGLLTPDRFLTIADDAGLMGSITRWCIRRVCEIAAAWSRHLPAQADFYIGVNLSASVLGDPALADYVATTLAETGTEARLLRFEVTEGSLISNVGSAQELLHRLHGLGVTLMLDDFGTGYSSLSYLQLFPFDCLKIDRSFVSRIGTDGAGGELLRAIVQLAASLGLGTVAEGVETQAVVEVLKQSGCGFAQGYLFSPPTEPEAVLQRLRAERQRQEPELVAQSA